LQSFTETPNMSTRKVATENEVSQSSVCNILKKHRFHPYKMLYVQEFHEDFNRKIKLCEFIETHGNDFVNNIVLSKKVSFEFHGNVNHQNFRYWNTENSHWMRDNKSQCPKSQCLGRNNWRSFNRFIFHRWKIQF